MPDKFDEMAGGMFMAYGITGIKRESLAAALRSTDAKAREEGRREERERLEPLWREYAAARAALAWAEGAGPPHSCFTYKHEARISAAEAAIREGADACGTCRGTGRIVPHFDAPEDDCPNARSVGVPGMDDCRSCGCEEVPCPACRVVGVDLAVPGSDFTVKLEGAPGELRHAADCPCPACQGGDDAE